MRFFLVILLSFFSLTSVRAYAPDHYLGFSASSMGFGGYYKYGFNTPNTFWSRVEMRASWEHFGPTAQDIVLGDDTTFEMDGITYEIGLESDVAGVAFDFYPFRRGSVFHLTFGGYYTNYLFNTHAWIKDTQTFDVGAQTLTVDGRVDAYGEIEWDSPIAPYLGFGLSGTLFSGVTLGFDLGVLYTGSPDINLTYSGTVDNGGTPVDIHTLINEDDIRAQTKEIEDDLMAVEYLPVIRLSLGVRF
ncbi:MAG: hypothetical protein JXQ74_01615 [Alphaproteobacteria bacterium]|nr:hypothetical protein [Alphaproteobacteria bacterium]